MKAGSRSKTSKSKAASKAPVKAKKKAAPPKAKPKVAAKAATKAKVTKAKPKVAAAAPRPKKVPMRVVLEIARQQLGIEAFRPGQEEGLKDILGGKDVLAVMPTGSGKSLLYQLPSLVLPGVTVVVSPLIALITDQVEKMREKGAAVARVDSTLTVRQKRAMLELVDAPGGKLLLTTPERMADPEFRKLLAQSAGSVGVSLFVVDEAHCVSQWGHDFRPAYLILGQAVEELGHPQVLATTATAPPHVRDDILHQLNIPRAKIITTSFDRPNLSFEVIASPGEDDKKKVLLALLKKLKRPGIVYCATVKAVEQLGEELARHGIPVATYHGRMTKSERDDMQTRFMDKRSKLVMVATNAFGLGVDKADIRYVIHYHVPGSLEQYAQEAGRGGRDGLPTRCVLLFSPDDVAIQEHFLKGTYPARRQVMAVLDSLEAWCKEGRHPTLAELAMGSHVGSQRTRTVLALMKDEGWVIEERGGRFLLSDPLPDREKVRDRARDYEKRRIADRRRLDALLEYVRAPTCRNTIILSYLGEKVSKTSRCGRCDNDLRSAAEARAVAQTAAELEEVLARQTAEAEGDLGDEIVTKPSSKKARTRVISLDGPKPAPVPEPPPAEESGEVEVEPIERTAAELAEDEDDSPKEIRVLKRKKRVPVPHPPPPSPHAHGRTMESRGGKKKRRRRRGKDKDKGQRPLGQVALPGVFSSPVLVVKRDGSPTPPPPPPAASGEAPSEATPPPSPAPVVAPPSPASHHHHHHAPRPSRHAGPIVEYVRRPMKIAVAPVASATPHDSPGAGRRRKGGFGGGRPHHQGHPGERRFTPPPPPAAAPQQGPQPPPSMAGGTPQPGTPSPPGQGKRRRRRRRRGGGGAQPQLAGGPPSPMQQFWMPAGQPIPPAPPRPPQQAAPAAPAGSNGAPANGPAAQPGSGKRRRRRRRRRGGGGPFVPQTQTTGGTPPDQRSAIGDQPPAPEPGPRPDPDPKTDS